MGGDAGRGLKCFFENFDEESVVARSMASEDAAEMLVLPQLRGLLSESARKQWRSPQKSIDMIEGLIRGLEKGELTA